MNYLYNGVELPALPAYDKVVYPYALISDRNSLEPTLVLTSVPISTPVEAIIGQNYVKIATECQYMRYILENNVWVIYDEPHTSTDASEAYADLVWSNYDIPSLDGTLYLSASDPVPVGAWTSAIEAPVGLTLTPGLDGDVYLRIYTDHDILDGTGAVWLAAGQVTPVEETGVSDTWKYSFKLGLALGLCCKPLPIVRKLIGYSYNGTVLPKLPEWDKETYPYAVIGKVSNYPDVYILVMGENAPTYSGDTEKVTIAMTNTNEPLQIAKCVSPYSAWGGVEDWSYYMCNFWTDLYWTNTDILSTDGTLYLSASDPVPVYK